MGFFRKRAHRAQGRPVAGVELTEEQRAALPRRFEAAGEALAAGSPLVTEACWVVGRDLAEVGVSLGESLEGLRTTTRLVSGRDPSFEEMHGLALAWSEVTLGYLHRLSCADPLTGLATMAHVRERISELYRDAVADSHALVVTEAHLPQTADGSLDLVAAARLMALLGETARSVFAPSVIVGQVGASRVVVLAPRDDSLASRVSLLKRMADAAAERVWIEGLPRTDESAAYLLDELARGA